MLQKRGLLDQDPSREEKEEATGTSSHQENQSNDTTKKTPRITFLLTFGGSILIAIGGTIRGIEAS